jgi:transposase
MDSSPSCDLVGIDVPRSRFNRSKEEPMEKTTVVGVDLAKTVFEIAVSNTPGQVSDKQRLPRTKFLSFFKELPPATVVMEACGSAHYWGRVFEGFGHTVVLLPPHLVKPYITRNKTDRADAKGILEAYGNDQIHRVPIKTVEQQTLGAVHRLRSRWIKARTAQVNTARGLLREFGCTIPVGIEHVVPEVRLLVEDADSKVPDALRPLLVAVCDQIELSGEQIHLAEQQLEELAEQAPLVKRLRTIPGIGLISGTALPAFVGTVDRFPTARHFACYLGLTPSERSSGTKRRLGGISKLGDIYLRTLLIHGARSVICHARKSKSNDRLRSWALRLVSRTRYNKAVTALANKLARVTWAVWKSERDYEPQAAA